MKKSLNNRFKGKRLVEGDENEITAHELLLKEENNKIVVKGKGTSGEVENMSGGNNIWYYIQGSTYDSKNKTVSAYGPYKDFKDFMFSKKHPIDTSPLLYFNNIPYKSTVLTQDKNISIKADSNYGAWTINIKVSPGTTGVAIPENESPFSLPIFVTKRSASIYKQDDLLESKEMIYDAASNILFFYSGSSSIKITINPELESSLRIFSNINNHSSEPMVNEVQHYIEFLNL